MSNQPETPFDSIENAKDYVKLLQQTVADARQEIATDLLGKLCINPSAFSGIHRKPAASTMPRIASGALPEP